MGTRGSWRFRHARRSLAWIACLLLSLAVVGCAALVAAERTAAALQSAGYQNVNVNVSTGSTAPAGGLVSVSYRAGPDGSDQSDARHAEKIVWDSYSGRFGMLTIAKNVGGCTGPVCATRSIEIASATYAQLARRFGPRPRGLDKEGTFSRLPVPGWVIALVADLVIAVIATVVIVLVLVLRRKRNRPPDPPGPYSWQPPPYGWPQ